MEDNIKILNKMKMFCSICEEEHDVELIEKEKEINNRIKVLNEQIDRLEYRNKQNKDISTMKQSKYKTKHMIK